MKFIICAEVRKKIQYNTILRFADFTCTQGCINGVCIANGICDCHDGYNGNSCECKFYLIHFKVGRPAPFHVPV